MPQAQPMIQGLTAQYWIADKGYDSQAIVTQVEAMGAVAVIPSKSNRKVQRKYDTHIYKERHQIECLFNRLKQFRRIATRYEKTASSFLGFIYLAASLVWLR